MINNNFTREPLLYKGFVFEFEIETFIYFKLFKLFKMVNINVTITDEEVYSKLKILCITSGKTLKVLVNEAIKEKVERECEK